MDQEKHVVESPIIGDARHNIRFKIGDKVIRLRHLSQEVLNKLATEDEVQNLLNRLDPVAFSGSYADLKDTPIIPEVPENVSAFNNDAGYLTAHQDISGKVDKENGKGLSANDFTDGYKEQLDSLGHINLNGHISDSTIHTDATEKAGWNAKYDKPSGGIPGTDLSADVQASLAKANSSIQEHQDISGKANISDLSAVATSGDYADLVNKPDLSTLSTMSEALNALAIRVGQLENQEPVNPLPHHVFLTQEQYDALAVKDDDTLYFILADEEEAGTTAWVFGGKFPLPFGSQPASINNNTFGSEFPINF